MEGICLKRARLDASSKKTTPFRKITFPVSKAMAIIILFFPVF